MDNDKKETKQPAPDYGVRGYSGCVILTDNEMDALGILRPRFHRIRMDPKIEEEKKNRLF